MEKNELPKEVADSLKASVKRRSLSQDYADGYKEGYALGATKLLEAEEKIKVLTYDNNRLKGEVEGLRVARDLLHEVLVMNEAWGDLPGEFINKVKTFLYGE